MEQKEINEILEKHKKWLNGKEGGEYANLGGANLVNAKLCNANLEGADLRYADLRCADLRYANLKDANFKGADLDLSCWPLWCGGLDVNIDDRIAVQLLYHTVQNALYSRNVSDRVKKILSAPEIVSLANEFHRVNECGKIEAE